MKFREAKRLVERAGWTLDRVRGSHYIYTKDGKEEIICQHSKELCKAAKKKVLRLVAESENVLEQEKVSA